MEDIVTNYKWTTTQGSYKGEAPRVFATAYEIDSNAITDAVKSYYSLFDESLGNVPGRLPILPSGSINNGISYYTNMHKTKGKEPYVFPFFNDDVRSLSNSWGDSYVGSTNGTNTGVDYIGTLKNAAEMSMNLINQTNAMVSGKYGALFEPPKFYQFSQDEGPVTVNFVLINTDADGDAAKNYKLITKLINDNRFKRDDGNSFLVTPPKLWSVIVPGYRAIRWASCNVAISLIGARRYIDLNGSKILVPEGYNVNLTFMPLYTEPSNFAEYYTKTGF